MEKLKNTTPDRELVARYISGDEKALEILIHRHKAKLFSAIIIFTKDRSLAEDLFQDLWIKVIEKMNAGKYNEQGTFSAWVSRVSYNLCVDYYRKAKRQPKGVEMDNELEILDIAAIDGELNPEQSFIKEQDWARIRQMVELLPQTQKEVVIMRHYFEFSFKEIAQTQEISINTALGQMRYALINLRKMIEKKKIKIN